MLYSMVVLVVMVCPLVSTAFAMVDVETMVSVLETCTQLVIVLVFATVISLVPIAIVVHVSVVFMTVLVVMLCLYVSTLELHLYI